MLLLFDTQTTKEAAMNQARRICVLLVCIVVLPSAVKGGFPSDEVVRDILKACVERFKQSAGIVVGMVDPSGTRFVS
tara:strand:+ start:173 stop:403 length:231 start_codon:yes stop_codon:yes gene_type:complete